MISYLITASVVASICFGFVVFLAYSREFDYDEDRGFYMFTRFMLSIVIALTWPVSILPALVSAAVWYTIAKKRNEI